MISWLYQNAPKLLLCVCMCVRVFSFHFISLECATLKEQTPKRVKEFKMKHYRKYIEQLLTHWTAGRLNNRCMYWPSNVYIAKHDNNQKDMSAQTPPEYDEIRKLHDIKLNLISTLSFIDYHFILCAIVLFRLSFIFYIFSSYYKICVHVFVVI